MRQRTDKCVSTEEEISLETFPPPLITGGEEEKPSRIIIELPPRNDTLGEMDGVVVVV